MSEATVLMYAKRLAEWGDFDNWHDTQRWIAMFRKYLKLLKADRRIAVLEPPLFYYTRYTRIDEEKRRHRGVNVELYYPGYRVWMSAGYEAIKREDGSEDIYPMYGVEILPLRECEE